jgi:hypothetical protein
VLKRVSKAHLVNVPGYYRAAEQDNEYLAGGKFFLDEVVYTDFTKELQRRKFNEASALLKQYRHKIIDKCDKLDVEMH